jgi:hypothetical protein
MRDRPAWFYRRDPWFWATWEGVRLAGLLAARDVSFEERIRRVEMLAQRAKDLQLGEAEGQPPRGETEPGE